MKRYGFIYQFHENSNVGIMRAEKSIIYWFMPFVTTHLIQYHICHFNFHITKLWLINCFALPDVTVSVDCPLYIRPHSKAVLNTAISADTNFLSRHLVMDYSLLVGMDETNKELVVGIIGGDSARVSVSAGRSAPFVVCVRNIQGNSNKNIYVI